MIRKSITWMPDAPSAPLPLALGKAKAFGHTCAHCVQCGVTVRQLQFRKTFMNALSAGNEI